MGKPAARISDMTAHGGVIVAGFPTVLIGSLPAARLGDMHVCPMATPGLPPIPHVGGPIILGSTGVFIGGQPAARVGDMAICVGPPDVIALGCFTVLIGEVAAGGGGGGGIGSVVSSVAAAAVASVRMAIAGNGGGGDGAGSSAEEGHWIEYLFVDSAGNPVGGVSYDFTAPDGAESEGSLGSDGRVCWSGPDAGQASVRLMVVSNAQWSADTAEVEEAVTMSADVEGYESETEAVFNIYERNVSGPDRLIASVEAQTQGSSVEAEWQYEYQEEPQDARIQASGGDQREGMGYSDPDYYFVARVERQEARSGFLEIRDYLEAELKDPDEEPIADQEYTLYLPNGQIRNGTTDGSGVIREENLPPGYCEIRFPDLPDNL